MGLQSSNPSHAIAGTYVNLRGCPLARLSGTPMITSWDWYANRLLPPKKKNRWTINWANLFLFFTHGFGLLNVQLKVAERERERERDVSEEGLLERQSKLGHRDSVLVARRRPGALARQAETLPRNHARAPDRTQGRARRVLIPPSSWPSQHPQVPPIRRRVRLNYQPLLPQSNHSRSPRSIFFFLFAFICYRFKMNVYTICSALYVSFFLIQFQVCVCQIQACECVMQWRIKVECIHDLFGSVCVN